MTIEWTQRYTLMPWSSKFGDALGGGNQAYMEVHLEAVIEQVWRYALGGCDRESLEAIIERVCRYIWRPRSSELGGRNHASLEMRLGAVIVRTWRPWSCEFGRVLEGSRWTERRVPRLFSSVNSQPWDCDKVTLHLSSHWEPVWWQTIV